MSIEAHSADQVTRLWLDTEFNEFKGDLISMALVAESGEECSIALDCQKQGARVPEHIMPINGVP